MKGPQRPVTVREALRGGNSKSKATGENLSVLGGRPAGSLSVPEGEKKTCPSKERGKKQRAVSKGKTPGPRNSLRERTRKSSRARGNRTSECWCLG